MSHLSELAWSRLLSGDLAFFEGLRLRRHLRRCSDCRAQRAALETERQAFEASPDFAAAIGALRARARSPAPAPRRALWILGALAPAGAVTLVFALPRLQGAHDDLAAKGGTRFSLVVKRGERTAPFGDRCQTGDAVRGTYHSPLPNIVVIGTDGAGPAQELFRAEGHHPLEGDTPGSWVLDGAPGRQCFTALFSARPLATADAELIAAGDTPPTGVEVIQRCCEKDVR